MTPESVFDVSLPPGPYPGLRPFEEDEWPIFFGRERMADAVVSQLIDKRLLVVHGDSGCGKSSLVRAAVLPQLSQASARGGRRWLTCTMQPREAPLWNLAVALAGIGRDGRADRDDAAAIEMRRALNLGADAADVVARLLRRDADDPVCILIDQFEELFAHARRHGPDEARLLTAFLVALQARAGDTGALHAVLTMRSEFLGHCARFEGFAELVNRTQYLLPRMDKNDLRRAIREPAALYDGEIALDLADRLIADAGGGQDQLPLIQHGLMLLSRRVRQGDAPWRLALADYPQVDGLAGLLSAHADEVMRASGAPEAVVEALFSALTDLDPADSHVGRLPQTLERLVAVTGRDEATLRHAIDAFRADGVSFLLPYGDLPYGRDELIDISHEALIRCWRKLADPANGWLVREIRAGFIWLALLVQAEEFEADPTCVLNPAIVEDRKQFFDRHTAAWAERYGGGWERVDALLRASLDARDAARRAEAERARRERRWRLLVMSGLITTAFFIVTTLLGGIAWREGQRAAAEAEEAKQARLQTQAELEEARRQFERLQSEVERREALQRETAQIAVAANAVVDQLGRAVSDSRNAAALSRNVESAKAALSQQVDRLAAVSGKATAQAPAPGPAPAIQPRLYIQIASENQRGAATRIAKALDAAAARGGLKVQVPGVELVKAPTSRSVVRCFRAEDCSGDGPRIVEMLNRALVIPRVELEDQSSRYGNSKSIRERHFELWLAPGDVKVSG